ncbi:MAG: cytochrome d ubiquinol oxidase subunit II [Proteobacteria bacterium]|jgi:cytochrome d ubiquinol oxidase subunit II|nr:cytochrome d ubiquinol oxidase subunit II [Desulfocapsa sp.]MBU3946546.1 cytochrome d ubiquinol oxidase subunit II [Pseudomonadota bacterium]MCG2745336.1 cytochrome d ubiquinol oxidase subunit II [Desulfobacteraceae bacterium]MBU3982387.1 cytochrome d ubiquinol oxidase subunit II [Pseudomonadota bacterium]MBU4028400.1 cytochrome d ubiquinol oxidase subunit II [Pseudomonadota bacterium]
MIANLDYGTLQQIWWILCSVVGSLFLFLTFVQGGNTLLWQVAKNDVESALVMNSLGRKWEMTFTTLVLFGGALFAAFPKFYATSFGGAYWVWMLILFTFIIQAVSFEYRKKPNNFLGAKVYESFLLINGTVGVLLIGAAVGTFFTGSNFTLNVYNQVSWTHPLRGLEAAFSLFNLSLGLFLVFNARVLGAMYLLNNINFSAMDAFEARLRKAVWINFFCALPFLLYVLVSLLLMQGFDVDEAGVVSMVANKYLMNLLAMPHVLGLLLVGLVLVILAVLTTVFKGSSKGIWLAGLGTVLVGLAVFFTAGFNNTPFYPSKADLQSSLTIYNASSSPYTLMAMTYVALGIPFVLAYVAYVWRQMDSQKLAAHEVMDHEAY